MFFRKEPTARIEAFLILAASVHAAPLTSTDDCRERKAD
jgi:hypothetical protein